SVDARALPASVDARAVSDRLASEFPQAHADPISVALSAPTGGPEARGVRRELADYASALAATPGAVAVERPVPVGADRWRIDVYGDAPALSPAGQDLVAAVRAVPAPHPAALTGAAASFSDQKASLGAHLPWAILVIAAATIIALFLMTGSLLLPIKAVIMNLLTLGATLGLLVWIFEDGRFEGLFRYDSVDALDITSPILLGAVAFGLATDYAVFLLSRIKEVHDTGADTPEAVAVGLQRTGRIITAAALLFAVAIGAFVSSDILMVKELGFGTAVAVLIDATIIRALLVPSLMVLLGRGNWWAPGPLRRLHERIGFAETAPPPRAGGG
ncbi:MAG TPA: MMPL family transporter, partial [Miltoncostaeaceae bacterium]|nr:MMPL family transporter [Miltoncostaeaceae bacterium]